LPRLKEDQSPASLWERDAFFAVPILRPIGIQGRGEKESRTNAITGKAELFRK